MAEKKKTASKKTNAKTPATKKSVTKTNTVAEAKKVSTKKTSVKKVEKKDVAVKEIKPVKEKKERKSFKQWIEGFTLNQLVVFGTIVVAILLVILICVSYRNTKTKDGSEIVVQVDGKTVTADDLYTELKSQNGRVVAIDIIDDYIINKEYKTTKEMKEEAESTVQSYKSNYGDQYESLIAYYGASNDAEFKEIIIKQNKISNITQDYVEETLTENEMKNYYETSIVGDIKASNILIGVELDDDATDEEKEAAYDEAKVKAEEVIEKLNNGADFAELAKEYSTDEGSKDNGGDLGYFNKGQMVQEFEDAAYALDLNKYTTEPVKTTYGYHVILKTAQKDKPSYKEAKDTVIEELVQNKISSDSTIYYKALSALRKNYGMKIKDKTIKADYDEYMKNAVTTTTTTTAAE